MSESFYKVVRPMFGGALTKKQVEGMEGLLAAVAGLPLAHQAYVLATAFHETDKSMQPVREYGRGKGKKYGVVDQTGKAPYGRGHVQLTWRENYVRADEKLRLGGRLSKDYDLALDPAISSRVIVAGMQEGWFTGKKMSDYLNAAKPDYVGARRIVNGTDKANLIAEHAVKFESALKADLEVPAPAPSGLFAALKSILKGLFA